MVHRLEPDARFFYVDTDLLFPETYETRDALAERYGIEFERIADLPQATRPGSASLPPAPRPDACCAQRKVATMRAALDGVIAGFRESAESTRTPEPSAQVRLG